MAFEDNELIFEGDRKTIGGVLQNFGNDLQEKLRESLRNKTSSNTTKGLEQSIRFDVKFESLGVWRFQLDFDDYGEFLDQGVQGKGGKVKSTSKKYPYRKKGDRWINKAPSSPFRFRDKKPKLTRGEGLSLWAYTKGISPFAVQNIIYRQGIKATNWYTDVVTSKLLDGLTKSLEEAGAKSIELSLVDILQGKTE